MNKINQVKPNTGYNFCFPKYRPTHHTDFWVEGPSSPSFPPPASQSIPILSLPPHRPHYSDTRNICPHSRFVFLLSVSLFLAAFLQYNHPLPFPPSHHPHPGQSCILSCHSLSPYLSSSYSSTPPRLPSASLFPFLFPFLSLPSPISLFLPFTGHLAFLFFSFSL